MTKYGLNVVVFVLSLLLCNAKLLTICTYKLHGKIKWTAILINDVNNKQLFKYLELLKNINI